MKQVPYAIHKCFEDWPDLECRRAWELSERARERERERDTVGQTTSSSLYSAAGRGWQTKSGFGGVL